MWFGLDLAAEIISMNNSLISRVLGACLSMRTLAFLACVGLALGQPAWAQTAEADGAQEQLPLVPLLGDGKEAEPVVCPVDEEATPATPEPPVQDYEPSPAMWKIADEDTTIYLFGTYHVLPQGFRWRTPLLNKVIAEADEVVFESREDEDEDAEAEIDANPLSAPKMSEEARRFAELVLAYRAETPLTHRLDPKNVAKFVRLLEQARIPIWRAERAPPMMTMLAISVRLSELKGSERTLGVESIIEAEFQESGRPISAIEDPIEVLENLFKIDEAVLIDAIDTSLEEWDGCRFFEAEKVDWATEHSWAKGELDEIDQNEMFDGAFGEAFYKVLVLDRNRAWIDWVKERMEEPGNLLLAVGAGHMEGPDSLVLMLQADGIEVERIQ